MFYTFFKSTLSLVATIIFIIGISNGCQKTASDTASNEPDFSDRPSSTQSVEIEPFQPFEVEPQTQTVAACGTPASIQTIWYLNGGLCQVRFTCGAVPNATLYSWEIHVVYGSWVDPTPYEVQNTSTPSWNWGGGYGGINPDCFRVYVKAKCNSGYGPFKKSTTKCPPSWCPCCP
jgi:hypothetical protein